MTAPLTPVPDINGNDYGEAELCGGIGDENPVILFKRKKENTYPEFDREKQIPVLKCSICTGEKVACFRDKRTGHTEEIMYIRSQGDMQDFLSRYGLSEQEIKKEW